jgi:hypothetical protein
MAGAHLAIRDAIAALFDGLAEGRIYQNRDYTLPQGVPSQINVHRVQSEPDRSLIGVTAPIDWSTDIKVAVTARKDAVTDQSGEQAADAIATACFSRVMADQQLGGLCQQIEPGLLTWEQDEVDSNVVVITWEMRVIHRTEFNAI